MTAYEGGPVNCSTTLESAVAPMLRHDRPILRVAGKDLDWLHGDTLHATGSRHDKPYLEVEGGGEVLLGALGLPINARVIEPVTVFEWVGPLTTPCTMTREGERLVFTVDGPITNARCER